MLSLHVPQVPVCLLSRIQIRECGSEFVHVQVRYGTGTKVGTVCFSRKREQFKESTVPSPTTFENLKFKCSFLTCGAVHNTPSKLKTHLLFLHTEAKKDCIYNDCDFSTTNRFTLKVQGFKEPILFCPDPQHFNEDPYPEEALDLGFFGS